MELNSFPINPRYSNIGGNSNPYHDFFLPCFSNSTYYGRYGGFFTSKNLAMCAEGIEEFIKNKGRMELVLTAPLTNEDLKAIKQGLVSLEKKIEDNWISEQDSIKEKIEKDHVRALAWMIAQDPPVLEIKLVVFKDSLGNPLSRDEIEESVLTDTTVGVFHDPHGNSVSFSGSIKKGLDDDDASIDIVAHKSWLQKDHVDADFAKFQTYWDSGDELLADEQSDETMDVIELPTAIKDKLIEQKPNSIEELDLTIKPKLRPYQKEARDSWFKHAGRGIFEMATGTGKTITSIGCIDKLVKNNEKLLVVIACPTNILVNQWVRELKQKWYFESVNTTKGSEVWKTELGRIKRNFRDGIGSNLQIMVSSYDSFCKKEFVDLIEDIQVPTMLIADEVHEAGSSSSQDGLIEKYEYRLGLSATPERYYDDQGTAFLQQYFKPKIDCGDCHGNSSVIVKKDLKWAIDNKILVPYYYYPYYIDLDKDELDEYRDMTRKVAPEMSKPKEKQNKKIIEIFLVNRAKIIKNASKKIDALQKIIQKNNDRLEYCLIYCAEAHGKKKPQIKQVQNILNKIPITNSIIKSDITSDAEKEKILTQITKGELNVGLAINILDQGVDIPPLKTAILLASTGNKKQFIQRRGRILRQWEGGTYRDGTEKEYAIIYDIFVVPHLNKEILEFADMEKSIVEKELRRHKQMVEISLNPDYGKVEIEKIKRIYQID